MQEPERMTNAALRWAPGTDDLSDAQLSAIRERHKSAIRPIPSRTAIGYDHLMADADRGALLAEVERLRARLEPGVPDENDMDRGFGHCPHCLSRPVLNCHECGTEVMREDARGFGWRMDHIGGYGCVALCDACR